MAEIGRIKVSIDMSQWEQVITKGIPKLKNNMPRFFNAILYELGGRAIDYAMPITRIDTGRLISSYKLSNVFREANKYGIVVYNQASENGRDSYAYYNEYGTSFMAPRLMLTTARERILGEMRDVVNTTFIKVVNGTDGVYNRKL